MKNTNKRDVHNSANFARTPKTLSEVLQNIMEDAQSAKYALCDDCHSTVMDRIYYYDVDERVPDTIQHLIADIKGGVSLMRAHDYTREQLQANLDRLISALDAAIQKEIHAEKVRSVSAFFTVLAEPEHAEAIVNWAEGNPNATAGLNLLVHLFVL